VYFSLFLHGAKLKLRPFCVHHLHNLIDVTHNCYINFAYYLKKVLADKKTIRHNVELWHALHFAPSDAVFFFSYK